MGLNILGKILKLDFDFKAIDSSIISNVLGETGRNRECLVDQIIHRFGLMSAYTVRSVENQEAGEKVKVSFENKKFYEYRDYTLIKDTHYSIYQGQIRLYVAGIYPKFIAWVKKYDDDFEIIPETTFKKQLKDIPYFVDNKPAKIGGISKNCYILNLKKMEKAGLIMPPEWDDDTF